MSAPTAFPRELGVTAFTRSNPLARLVPAAALGVVNVLTIDLVTPLLTLLLVVASVPLLGLSSPQLFRVTWPLGMATLTLFVVNTLAFGAEGIGAEDLYAGTATALRLLAVALPGVLALATIDQVDLTDALVQQLHVPPRFGYGSLAALRLLPLLTEDWNTQRLAARARGVSARGIIGRARALFQRVLLLLVSALRRATRLATALDARGFDAATRRTARPSVWTVTDTMWSVLGVLLAALVVAASVGWGSWDPLLG